MILDEPGNDLDTDMLAQLESLLDTWPGTLILVSHDRYLVERVTDDQYALIDGEVIHMPRGVDQYLEELDRKGASGARSSARSAASDAKQGGVEEDGLSQRELRELKKRRYVCGAQDGHAAQQARQGQRRAARGLDGTDFVALGQQQEKIFRLRSTELEALEDSWLEIAEKLEG